MYKIIHTMLYLCCLDTNTFPISKEAIGNTLHVSTCLPRPPYKYLHVSLYANLPSSQITPTPIWPRKDTFLLIQRPRKLHKMGPLSPKAVTACAKLPLVSNSLALSEESYKDYAGNQPRQLPPTMTEYQPCCEGQAK